MGLVASNVSPPMASMTASDLASAVAVADAVLEEMSIDAPNETTETFADRAARTSHSVVDWWP